MDKLDSVVFTPASLLDLLSQIEELEGYDLGITETLDGKLQLTVGESTYMIDSEDATEVSVDDSVVETIEDTNLAAYENLDDSVDVAIYEDGEPIESGIIKELAKTLLVGGLVRLAGKAMK